MCVTFFCIYVSTLQLPISAFSKAFDCKGMKKIMFSV